MTTAEVKRYYRSRDDRMIAGVAGGLGEFLGIDPTIVRLFFAFGTLLGGPGLLVAYLVMMLVVPEEPLAVVSTSAQAEPEPEAESKPKRRTSRKTSQSKANK